MFSLIVTTISIILVAVVAFVGVYYGGDMWGTGSSKAKATQYMNEAAQINGAIAVYRNDNAGAMPTQLSDLAGTYLKTLPAGDWSMSAGSITRTGLSINECSAVNKSMGFDTVNTCDVASAEEPCCELVP